MYRLQICTILQREMTEGASSAAQTSMKKAGGWITWWNFVPATWEQPQRGLSDLLFASIAWCKQICRYGMLQQNNLRGLQLCQSDTRLDQKCPICRKQHQKQMTKSKELYEKSIGKWSSCNVPNWDVCLSGEETYKRLIWIFVEVGWMEWCGGTLWIISNVLWSSCIIWSRLVLEDTPMPGTILAVWSRGGRAEKWQDRESSEILDHRRQTWTWQVNSQTKAVLRKCISQQRRLCLCPSCTSGCPWCNENSTEGGSRRMDEEDESWLVALSILNLKNLLSAI